MVALPFYFGSNPGRNPRAGVARLVNCYASDVGEGQRARLPIHASPGLTSWGTHSGSGDTRRMIVVDSQMYVVKNRVLSVFDTSGTETVLGGIASDGLVTAHRNRQRPYPQIVFTCEGRTYICQNNVLTEMSDSDLPPALASCFLAGYSLFAISDGRVFYSNIDDASTVEALDFFSAEDDADGLVNIATRSDDLVLIGPRSTQFHRITTDVDAPFARSTTVSFGCLAPKSVCEVSVISKENISNTLGWVATGKGGRYEGVILLDGYGNRKISTEALDKLIRDDAAQSEITATAWASGGHGFYCVTGSTWSWIFDTSTGLWHERETYNASRWQVSQIVDFNGTLIAGGRTGSTLYSMSDAVGVEGADPLVMTIQSSPVVGEVEINELELDVETGVGTLSETDPQMMMQWSEDGSNWSTERSRSLGAAAQTSTEVRWHRLGTNRNGIAGRSFRFRCSANVVRAVYGAEVNPKSKVLVP